MSLLDRLRRRPDSVSDTSGWTAVAVDVDASGLVPGSDCVTGVSALRFTPYGPVAAAWVGSGGMPELLALLGAADVVVVHNADRVRSFLAADVAGRGEAIPSVPWICTMRMARAVHPDWLSYRLPACASQLGLDPGRQAGPAPRVNLVAGVFIALAEQVGITSRSDLAGLVARFEPPPTARVAPGVDSEPAVRDGWDVTEEGGVRVSIHTGSAQGGLVAEMVIDLKLPFLDPELSDEQRQVVFEEWRANIPICGDLSMGQITDLEHRAAHENELETDSGAEFSVQLASVDRLLRAGCPSTGHLWSALPGRCGKGSKGSFELGVAILRHFREHGYPVATTAGVVRSMMYEVQDIAAGPKLLLAAWQEFGVWLADLPPCEWCLESRRQCEDLDLSVALANALEARVLFDEASAGRAVALAQHMVGPGHLAGSAVRAVKEPIATWIEGLGVLEVRSPERWARIVTRLAWDMERVELSTSLALYDLVIMSGRAPYLAFDRASLAAERAHDFERAVTLALEGAEVAHAEGRDPDTLAKRAVRCRARLDRRARVPPSSSVAPVGLGGAVEETLTCRECGSQFDRVRTKGRKPHLCPPCRDGKA